MLVVCTPLKVPAAEKVTRPTAVNGSTGGAPIVPFDVYAYFPATPAKEHECALTVDAIPARATTRIIPRFIRTMARFSKSLLCDSVPVVIGFMKPRRHRSACE
jgi:hypothetical protein